MFEQREKIGDNTVKYLPLLFILTFTGCAITDVEREERMQHSHKIKQDFQIFVSDCQMTEGELVIDRPSKSRRVHNAPITVWEMKDAVCYYDDTYPRKMSD